VNKKITDLPKTKRESDDVLTFKIFYETFSAYSSADLNYEFVQEVYFPLWKEIKIFK